MELPDDVVRRVFTAVAERRYHDVPAFVDPDDLNVFHQQTLSSARHIDETPPRTAGDYIRDQPELPRAVAEYFAEQHATAASHRSHLAWEFAGITSASDIESIDPAGLLERWVEAKDPDYQLQQQLRAQGHTTHAEYLAQNPTSHIERTVIGSVLESDDVAHVVYRISWGGSETGTLKVASLRRRDDRWLMRFDHDFLGQANFFVSIGAVDEIPGDAVTDP